MQSQRDYCLDVGKTRGLARYSHNMIGASIQAERASYLESATMRFLPRYSHNKSFATKQPRRE